MEESSVQQQRLERSGEGGPGWKEERSLSSLLKHSCLFCWSPPREPEPLDTDDRVLAKAAEIRELEHAVAVESLELQEQQSDRSELEETLVKLEDHKEKLVQQIKTTRQLCYQESQQILSLQAEEVQKESQVEEYERELARARWRLKKLREEVKQAKKKVEEAGERNTPLQDSIRQSYEEILQEEHALCSLSGSAVTPESQLEESASPADTTEEDPLPMRPWGRSQSLPAYADMILDANASSFCNNLAGTREEDDSGTSSTKMDRSDIDDDPEDEDLHVEQDQDEDPEQRPFNPDPVNQLDFYQADPFAHVQSDHDLFNEDLFPKTDSSGGFASDPFKGSDPFAADMMFPGPGEGPGNGAEEADTSLSCTENKASTGTQCFESEFPDEDSDIEISYSREDLEAIVVVDDPHSFKPIQSSSEELGPVQCWRSQGQYSVESDPNGYELDLGAISPPSDIEEHSLGSLAGEGTQDLSLSSAEPALLQTDLTINEESRNAGSVQAEDCVSGADEARNPTTPQNSLEVSVQPSSGHNSFELNYNPGDQSSFDPYGFKLSPEHSSHTLLDPDEAELSPEIPEHALTFDPEPSSAQQEQLSFDHYDFDINSSTVVRDSDPYGFKLSPEEEEENQEVLELCDPSEQVELSNYTNQEVYPLENQEVLENNQELLDMSSIGNQEVIEPSSLDHIEQVLHENRELPDFFGHDNQEVVEPFSELGNEERLDLTDYDNQEVLEPYSNQELLDLSCPENQEVLDLDIQGNQELLDLADNENHEVFIAGSHGHQIFQHHSSNENQELLDFGSHDNQEVMYSISSEIIPESNNNKHQCSVEPQPLSSSSCSDSDVAPEDLQAFSNSSVSTAHRDHRAPAAPTHQHMLEGDLGSVFGAGGYVGCPDVADDLEPMDRRQVTAAAEPATPPKPVRPPRPSLRAKARTPAQNQGIDLK